jgi:hypothetical protein
MEYFRIRFNGLLIAINNYTVVDSDLWASEWKVRSLQCLASPIPFSGKT